MKNRFVMILGIVGICILLVLGVGSIACEWEEITQSESYYYPEEKFIINGEEVENTRYTLNGEDINEKEYKAIKIKCDVLMKQGEIDFFALEDAEEKVIKEWTPPITSFEEELDKETYEKLAFSALQGSKGSEGKVTITICGKPKLLTRIKREINYLIGY